MGSQSKKVPGGIQDQNCRLCSFIASSLIGPSHKHFKDGDGELVVMELKKRLVPPQGIRFADGQYPAVCEDCARFLMVWIQLREQRHYERMAKQPPKIVVATPSQMNEVLANQAKVDKIVRPGVGGKLLK